MKRVFRCVCLGLLASTSVAADPTGWWSGIVGDQPIALTLKKQGERLKGFVTYAYFAGSIANTRMTANSFEFETLYEGNVIPFKGTLTASGEMDLSMLLMGYTLSGHVARLKEGEVAPASFQVRPEMTEYREPVPPSVDPGPYPGTVPPPSDAIALFDGRDLSQWKSRDGSDARWRVANGTVTVVRGTGDISTRREFGDYQLHLEWRSPEDLQGVGQLRGNSGLFLQDASYQSGIPRYWYEIQILDSYENPTYVNGQAASVYKQNPPLVNAMRRPGEWNVYDVIYTAPRFNSDGSLFAPARVTLFHNGVLAQDHFELRGRTSFIGLPVYLAPHGKAPISLQNHGDPVSFRNIWIREREAHHSSLR